MKKTFINILSVIAVSAMISCEPGDSQKDLGFPVIYIPQATMTGLDNSYPVPAGPLDQLTTCNCKLEDGKLKVIVGVLRSGFISEQKGFSVTLGECPDETDRKLQEYSEAGTPAMALPQGTFTVPSEIKVPDSQSGATCYVTIDLAALSSHRDEIVIGDGGMKLLVLGLEISDPTEYSLAQTNTSVVMVIDPASAHWGDAPLI